MNSTEKEIRKVIPFTIGSKNKAKRQSLNISKDVTDLCNENYKGLKKEKGRRQKEGSLSWSWQNKYCSDERTTKSEVESVTPSKFQKHPSQK
jgi:hypothetical protein